ncbi:MAG: hypothetical protein Q9184_005633 [Pyrenodesmia sp. 2 TL-2023]
MNEGQRMSAFSSEVFTIYAGPSQKKFIAHAGVLAQSPTLRKIVDGGWKESQERTIPLDEWDEKTVQKLLEWLYSGYYTWYTQPISPTTLAEGAEDATANVKPKSCITSLGLKSERMINVSPYTWNKKQSLSKPLYYHMSSGKVPSHPVSILRHGITYNDSSSSKQLLESLKYSDVQRALDSSCATLATLLDDAKLYVLAQYLQLGSLKRLAFLNVQHVFSELSKGDTDRLGAHVTARFIEYIRYVYASTDSLTNSMEPLRKLTAAAVVAHLHALQAPSFDDLMRQGGDFAVDVMKMFNDKAVHMSAQERKEEKLWEQAEATKSFVIKPPFRMVRGHLQREAFSATSTDMSTYAFESPVFEIIAGKSGNTKTFRAHASVLSKSKVLKTEVEGLWKESAERKIQWPHWTVDGAEKFLEWLYTGDYKCPYPTKCPQPEAKSAKYLSSKDLYVLLFEQAPTDERSEVTPEGDTFERFGITYGDSGIVFPTPKRSPAGYPGGRQIVSATKKSKTQRQARLPSPALARLQDLTFTGCRPLGGKLSQAEEFDKWTGHQLWKPTELDYETTFMTHAELYIMANTYMLDDLKNMAWQRLRAVLISIGRPTPGSTVVDNLASLSHYVYTETGATGAEGMEEPLRMLVLGFASLHFTSLKGQRMEELMMSKEEADREFVVDLMGKVSQQMSYLESENDVNSY